MLKRYYDLFQTTSTSGLPYANRTKARPDVVAARLLELKLLGREIAELEPVLVQPVATRRLRLGPHPPGVLGGLRCPATGEEADPECTLFVVNLTPQPQKVASEVDGSSRITHRLAPYGVAVVSLSGSAEYIM